jgi:hypothetical protein
MKHGDPSSIPDLRDLTHVGRPHHLRRLHAAWSSANDSEKVNRKTNVICIYGEAGGGKTTLLRTFSNEVSGSLYAEDRKLFYWSACNSDVPPVSNGAIYDLFVKLSIFFCFDQNAGITMGGNELAKIISRERCLVIIDDLDAAPINFDQGGCLPDDFEFQQLVSALARCNNGLLIITSKAPLARGNDFKKPRVVNLKVGRLRKPSATRLLSTLGIMGNYTELSRLADQTGGHALSLALVGHYVATFHEGNVRSWKTAARDIPPFTAKGNAKCTTLLVELFRVIFSCLEGIQNRPLEAVALYLIGLFCGAVERRAIKALIVELNKRAILGELHSEWQADMEKEWSVAIERLSLAKLVRPTSSPSQAYLEVHPAIQNCLATIFKAKHPFLFAECHAFLFDLYKCYDLPSKFKNREAYTLLVSAASSSDYLSWQMFMFKRFFQSGGLDRDPSDLFPTATPLDVAQLETMAELIGTTEFDDALDKFLPSSIHDMSACIKAIYHGSLAARHTDVLHEVYRPRILRGEEAFLNHRLGATGIDAGIIANFFQADGIEPANMFDERSRRLVLNYAAFNLAALGRVDKAIYPLRRRLSCWIDERNWNQAAPDATDLSELYLLRGEIDASVATAQDAKLYAQRSNDLQDKMLSAATLGLCLHQASEPHKAERAFRKAEAFQAKLDPGRPMLYARQGYGYLDYLLSKGQHTEVFARASKNLTAWIQTRSATQTTWALEYLALAKAAMAFIKSKLPVEMGAIEKYTGMITEYFGNAVVGLRCAGMLHLLPYGLLGRASFSRTTGEFTSAKADLEQVYQIGCYGGMHLHVTDYHLERARLALVEHTQSPRRALKSCARVNVESAERLIEDTGYRRRLPELAALKLALDDELCASLLNADTDRLGRPALAWLAA